MRAECQRKTDAGGACGTGGGYKICDDCVRQGFHNGIGNSKYMKYFCCSVCGRAQPDNLRANDAHKRLCNKCWNKKQKMEKLKKEGYGG